MGYLMKTNGCCCCFGLRTGTLILLWMEVVAYILTILNGIFVARKETTLSVYFFVLCYYLYILAFAAIAGLALYGIYQKRPSFLKIYVVSRIVVMIISIAFAIILILFLIFGSTILKNVIEEVINYQTEGHGPNHAPATKEEIANMTAALGVFIFLWILIIAISVFASWYYTSVAHSYYMRMKDESKTEYAGYEAPPKEG